MPNAEFEKHAPAVKEMIERVIELTRSYTIWWQLVEQSNFERFSQVIDNYRDFFEATTHSLFQGFTVITYQLFDKRKGTTSLQSLVKALALADAVLAKKLQTAIDEKLPLLQKVYSIRCNVYAHRNKSQPPEVLFEEIKLLSEQMREILDLARDLVSTLSETAGNETKIAIEEEIKLREDCSKDDTRRIIEALN